MNLTKAQQLCADEETIKDFLGQSRRMSDDKMLSFLTSSNCEGQAAFVRKEWQKRDDLLTLCEGIAGTEPKSGTPPDAKLDFLWEHARDNIELRKTAADPRVDSYAAWSQANSEVITNWVRRERMTEDIVQDATKQLFKQRCPKKLELN